MRARQHRWRSVEASRDPDWHCTKDTVSPLYHGPPTWSDHRRARRAPRRERFLALGRLLNQQVAGRVCPVLHALGGIMKFAFASPSLVAVGLLAATAAMAQQQPAPTPSAQQPGAAPAPGAADAAGPAAKLGIYVY